VKNLKQYTNGQGSACVLRTHNGTQFAQADKLQQIMFYICLNLP